MADIQYRTAKESDRQGILALYEAAFGRVVDEAHWTWEYRDPQVRPLVVVASVDGKIVGHYAVLPRLARINGRTRKIGLVVDVMTHPAFGRRGIFVNSALTMFSKAANEGVEMLIGFPNDAAIRGHMKAGWQEIGYLRVYAKPLSILRILNRVLKGRITLPCASLLSRTEGRIWEILDTISNYGEAESYVDEISVDEFMSQWNDLADLLNESPDSHVVAPVRSLEWMKWRVSDPSGTHRVFVVRDRSSGIVEGYAILKMRDFKGLSISALMDVRVRDESGSRTTARLLGAASRTARSEGCDALLMLRNPSSMRSRESLGMLFLPTPKRLRLIARPLSDSVLPESVLNPLNWCLELIDHDTL